MSEKTEPSTQPVVTTTTEDIAILQSRDRRPSRAGQAVAWVGVVAGTVFVVAVIFFSGFILGKHSDGGGRGLDGPRHHAEMMFREGPPMMRPGPDFGPGPGNAGADQPQGPTSPARP